MEYSDERRLENFLRDLKSYMGHLSITTQHEMIVEIKKFILDSHDKGKIPLKLILDSLSDYPTIVNKFLLEKGHPPTKKKKRSAFKAFIVFFSMSFLVFLITGYFFIKSLLPIYDVDKKTGGVKLFGGKVKLDNNSFYFSNSTAPAPVQLQEFAGEIEAANLQQISIIADYYDGSWVSAENDNFKYSCESSKIHHELVDQVNKKIVLNIPGKSKCTFFIPESLSIIAQVKSGSIVIDAISNEGKIQMVNGNVNLLNIDPSKIAVNATLINGHKQGDFAKYNRNGIAKVLKINVDNGFVSIAD